MNPVFSVGHLTNHREFFTTNDKVMQQCNRGTVKTVSDYMKINSIQHNIETNLYQGVITYKAFGMLNTLLVSRNTYLQRRKILELQNNGLDVTEENASLLVKYFKEEEDFAELVECVHSTLGFGSYNGQLIFKHYKAIGIESSYSGQYNIKPRGSFKVCMHMLKEEVLGNPAMETILVAGLSSVLLAYLSNEYSLDSLILHLASDSSTGKSTALKMASSLWSISDVKADSLFATYNSTNSAILSKLTGLNGIPYFLDEISMSDMTNFTSLIYSIVNGVEKERLTKDSKLMEKKTWLSSVISSGERSLVGSANKNKGLSARVFEISNVTFTRNAENAERIQRVIQNNYGHVGPKYVEYILSLKKHDICKRFEEIRETFIKEVKATQSTDDLFERRTLKYAVLLLTAEYFEKFSGLSLSMSDITKLLMIMEEESSKTRNFHDSVISYIKDYILINPAAFGLQGSGNTSSYGKVIPRKGYTEVLFYKTAFKKMLQDANYEEEVTVLKELKSKGYLDCEIDRYTRSRKMPNGIIQDVYVLKLDKAIMQKLTKDQNEEGDEKHE